MNITDNTKAIKDLLELDVDQEDIGGLQGKLLDLVAMSGMAAKTASEAKKRYLLKQLEVMNEIEDEDLPASIRSKKVESMCASESVTLTYTETLLNQMDKAEKVLITIVSMYKQEMIQGLREVPNREPNKEKLD